MTLEKRIEKLEETAAPKALVLVVYKPDGLYNRQGEGRTLDEWKQLYERVVIWDFTPLPAPFRNKGDE
jgi:hypothetical protein